MAFHAVPVQTSVLIFLLSKSLAQADTGPWSGNETKVTSEDVRIHGGNIVNRSIPYAAVIVERRTFGSTPILALRCSASYLGDGWVLTAAHCLPLDSRYTQIWLGSQNISTPPLFSSNVAEELRPPKLFISLRVGYDIALIKMKEPVPENLIAENKVKPICILADPIKGGTPVTALGYGSDTCLPKFDPRKAVLKSAEGSMLDKCPLPIIEAVHTGCVMFDNGGIPYLGDSGGPIVTKWKDGRDVQVGLVSRGNIKLDGLSICPNPTYPTPFPRLSFHVDWIASKYPGLCTIGSSEPVSYTP